MKLTLESSEDGIGRVRCEGAVHLELTAGGPNPLIDLFGNDRSIKQVLLNMEEAASINSTGVAWLVRSHRQLEQDGGRLVIHSIPPMVSHVLSLLNMQRLLHLAEDEYEALALLSGDD